MTQRCRVCGCSNFSACAGSCWWVEDDLCSSCAGEGTLASVEAAVATAFGVVEAQASIALDRDPDHGTHSLDDGCPGGHR